MFYINYICFKKRIPPPLSLSVLNEHTCTELNVFKIQRLYADASLRLLLARQLSSDGINESDVHLADRR